MASIVGCQSLVSVRKPFIGGKFCSVLNRPEWDLSSWGLSFKLRPRCCPRDGWSSIHGTLRSSTLMSFPRLRMAPIPRRPEMHPLVVREAVAIVVMTRESASVLYDLDAAAEWATSECYRSGATVLCRLAANPISPNSPRENLAHCQSARRSMHFCLAEAYLRRAKKISSVIIP